MGSEPDKKSDKSHRTQIFVALIALVGVLGAALIANWPKIFPLNNHDATNNASPATPSPRTVTATFVYPAQNAEIPLKAGQFRIELQGTVEPAAPMPGSYWIVVRDDGGHYYTQGKLAVSQSGTWTHSVALGLDWRGRSASVLVVFARNDQAATLLQESVNKELSNLPDNVTRLTTLNLNVQQ